MFGLTPELEKLPFNERIAHEQITSMNGELLSPQDFAPTRALNGELVHGQLLSCIRPIDGKQFWISVSAAPIRTVENKIRGVIANISDITNMRELQQQQEDFLYLVAHDLRTPLLTINSYTQLLDSILTDAHIDSDAKIYTDSIAKSIQQMNSMIQDLVEAAQIAGGRLQLNLQEVNIDTYIQEIVSRFSGIISTGQIRLEIPENLPLIHVDPNRFERIVTNLINKCT